MEIRRRILPKDHPRIASSMTNLAVTYDALGMHEEAAKMEEDALEIRKRTLPTVGVGVAQVAESRACFGRGIRLLVVSHA